MIRLLKWCYEKGCVWVLDTQEKTHSTFCVERSCCVFEFVFVKGDGEGIVDPDGEIEAETI